MEDRVMLITGSTAGIGKQTALELGAKGAKIILHGRDSEKGEKVLEELKNKTGNQKYDLLVADLSSQREVRELASQIQEKYAELHVLINNAGVFMNQRKLTEDGLETTFAVNHLAPFLLTNLLLDLLKKSAPSRIITVSSMTHQSAWVDFENLQGEKHFTGYQAYALSKMGNIFFAYELAERLKNSRVTANCLHPGVIDTKLLRAGYGPGGGSVEKGAETPVYLATSREVEQVSGQYFRSKKAVSSDPTTYDKSLQKELWKISEQLTGLL